MSRLEVNKELALGMVVTTISKLLGCHRIDTESLTMDELFITCLI
jgi:hypothetical protein